MCGGDGISGEAGVGRRGAIGGALANLRPPSRETVAPISRLPGGLARLRPSPRVAAPPIASPAVSTGIESLPASPRGARNRRR